MISCIPIAMGNTPAIQVFGSSSSDTRVSKARPKSDEIDIENTVREYEAKIMKLEMDEADARNSAATVWKDSDNGKNAAKKRRAMQLLATSKRIAAEIEKIGNHIDTFRKIQETRSTNDFIRSHANIMIGIGHQVEKESDEFPDIEDFKEANEHISDFIYESSEMQKEFGQVSLGMQDTFDQSISVEDEDELMRELDMMIGVDEEPEEFEQTIFTELSNLQSPPTIVRPPSPDPQLAQPRMRLTGL